VNLASTVPGWKRYEPMQRRLDTLMPKAGTGAAAPRVVEVKPAGGTARQASPDGRAEQERLFQQFLETRKRQPQ
jgi:hypothetical protein